MSDRGNRYKVVELGYGVVETSELPPDKRLNTPTFARKSEAETLANMLNRAYWAGLRVREDFDGDEVQAANAEAMR